MEFSLCGTMLATAGSEPDFTLTVWDWENELARLRNNETGQEVFQIAWSEHRDNYFVTCGHGHIRFWQLATTFTGPKLLPEVGKFGSFDLSDVQNAFELVPGRTLSTTEYGDVLVWDGEFTSFALKSNDAPLHSGKILSMQILDDGKRMLTSGDDCRLRLWDIEGIDLKVPDDGVNEVCVHLLKDIQLGDSAINVHVLENGTDFIVISSRGDVYQGSKLTAPGTDDVTTLFSLFRGDVTAVVPSQSSGHFLACFLSGRCSKVGSDTIVPETVIEFPSGVTCSAHLLNADATTVAVLGFQSGMVRLVHWDGSTVSLLATERPFKEAITSVGVQFDASSNYYRVAAASKKGELAFMVSMPQDTRLIIAGFARIFAEETMRKRLRDCDRPQQAYISYTRNLLVKDLDVRGTALGRIFVASWPTTEKESKVSFIEPMLPPLEEGDETEEESNQETRLFVACMSEMDSTGNVWIATESPMPQTLFSIDGEGAVVRSVSLEQSRELGHSIIVGVQLFEEENSPLSFVLRWSDGLTELAQPHDDEPAKTRWSSHGHVMHGIVASVGVVETLLCSGDASSVLMLEELPVSLAEAKKPQELHVPTKVVEDIRAEKFDYRSRLLNIQQQQRIQIAEEKKAQLTEALEDLKKRWRVFKERHDNIPKELQLPDDQIDLDRQFFDRQKQRCIDAIKKKRRELRWHEKKAEMAFKKLDRTYRENLEEEEYAVYGFGLDKVVRSFEIVGHTEDIKLELQQHEFNEEAEGSENDSDEAADKSSTSTSTSSARKTNESEVSLFKRAEQVQKTRVDNLMRTKNLPKFRHERARLLEEWEAGTPASTWKNPDLQKRVDEAIVSSGALNLKSSKDYTVPKESRVSAETIRRRRALLEDEMKRAKIDFNSRVRELRSQKEKIVESCNVDVRLLMEIENLLVRKLARSVPNDFLSRFEFEVGAAQNLKDRLAVAAVPPEYEYVEARWTVTDQQVEEHTENSTELTHEPKMTRFEKPKQGAITTSQVTRLSSVDDVKVSASTKFFQIRFREFWVKHLTLTQSIRKRLDSFDHSLHELTIEREKLAADLMVGHLRSLTMLREEKTLADSKFDGREQELLYEQDKLREKQMLIKERMRRTQDGLCAMTDKVQQWEQAETAVREQFLGAVGGEHGKNYSALLKIYMRQPSQQRLEKSTSSESNSLLSASTWDLSDNDSGDDLCPPNCDPLVFERVLAVRDKRWQQEAELAELEAQIVSLNTTAKELRSRFIEMQGRLTEIEKQIAALQNAKMSELNLIHVFFVLNERQIHVSIEPGTAAGKSPLDMLPKSAKDVVILTSDQIAKLQARETEVSQMASEARQEAAMMHSAYKTLKQQQKHADDLLRAEQEKLTTAKRLKFGTEELTLEKIDDARVVDDSRSIQDMLERAQRHREKQHAEARSNEERLRARLGELLQSNTAKMRELEVLVRAKRRMEDNLEKSGYGNMHVQDPSQWVSKVTKEVDTLLDLCRSQAKQIDTLKGEIYILQHKGGHKISNRVGEHEEN
ncbi:MAG: hypothetical protein MHM6MM_000067 [Cercozoa sp. M6MM]